MIKKVQISQFYPNIKDCYYITSDDHVINVNTGRTLSPIIGKNGYVRYSVMQKKGGTTYIQFHRVKMMAFNPTDNMENLQINHIDGNKQNNDLSNLEWVTAKQNIQHAWKNNLATSQNISGEKSNFSHYTEEQALEVIALLKTSLYTDKEIAKITNTNAKTFVSRIRRKETWKELTKNIDYPLGKAEHNWSFNKKSSTTISKESRL